MEAGWRNTRPPPCAPPNSSPLPAPSASQRRRHHRERAASTSSCAGEEARSRELQAKLFLGTKFFSDSRRKRLRGRVGGETKHPASYCCRFSPLERLEVEVMLPKAYRNVRFFLHRRKPAPLGTTDRSCAADTPHLLRASPATTGFPRRPRTGVLLQPPLLLKSPIAFL